MSSNISWSPFLLDFRFPTSPVEIQQRKLLYTGLYLLIWGEAANLRFMPECLCYIYHNVRLHFSKPMPLTALSLYSDWTVYSRNLRQYHTALRQFGSPICSQMYSCYVLMQMAYEVYGILSGNVSLVTGENIKPAYGGDEESFLRQVITPIYDIVEKVHSIGEA